MPDPSKGIYGPLGSQHPQGRVTNAPKPRSSTGNSTNVPVGQPRPQNEAQQSRGGSGAAATDVDKPLRGWGIERSASTGEAHGADSKKDQTVEDFKRYDRDGDLKVSVQEFMDGLIDEYVKNGKQIPGEYSDVGKYLTNKYEQFLKNAGLDEAMNIDEFRAMVESRLNEIDEGGKTDEKPSAGASTKTPPEPNAGEPMEDVNPEQGTPQTPPTTPPNAENAPKDSSDSVTLDSAAGGVDYSSGGSGTVSTVQAEQNHNDIKDKK